MGNSTGTTRTLSWPAEPANSDAKTPEGGGASPAGRIVHDERGNAVWRGDTTDSTSTMLRRLELPGLKVEGQDEPAASPPVPAAKAKGTPPPDVSSGYNPYDQRKVIKKPTTPKGPVGRRTR
jgi:hypothetical protein